MNDDIASLARRVINIFPHARDVVAAAAVLSGGLYAFLIIFQPVIETRVKLYVNLYPPNSIILFLFVLFITSIGESILKRFSKKARNHANFDNIVDALERTMAKAQYTKVERKAVWREVITRLARSAKLDEFHPAGEDLTAILAREMPESDRSSTRV